MRGGKIEYYNDRVDVLMAWIGTHTATPLHILKGKKKREQKAEELLAKEREINRLTNLQIRKESDLRSG